MKVLFVIHTPKDPLSAVFAYTQARCQALASFGHESEIWSPADFPATRGIRAGLLPFLFAQEVARHLHRRGGEFDGILFHSHSAWAFARTPRSDSSRPKCVVQFHGLEPLYFQSVAAEYKRAGVTLPLRHRLLQSLAVHRLIRSGCRHADWVFCLNREERRFLVDRGWASPNRVLVMPSAVPDEFLATSARRGDAPRLLFLGQWELRKGIRHLVSTFSRLAGEFPRLTLRCVGTRTPTERVLNDFPEQVRARVTVLESADRKTVAAEYASADIFVFPTLCEGASLALLEAMASGLAIVATRIGAAPDIHTDGEDALLVAAGDESELSDSVRRLVVDVALRGRLSEGARAKAQHFAWSKLAPRYVATLEQLLVRNQESPTG